MNHHLPFGCKGQFGFLLIIQIVVILFVLGLIAYTVSEPMDEITNGIVNDNSISAENKAISTDIRTQFPAWFDAMFVTLLVFGWILLIAAALTVSEHPIFFVVAIVFSIAIIFVAIELANNYVDLAEDQDFSEFRDDFPKLDFIMQNFLIFVLVLVISTAVALYAGGRT